MRHWDWSETSQTVSLFTRGSGVVRCIAKGAKREKSPYSGGLELATRGEAMLIPKSGEAMWVLTAWDLREAYAGPRQSVMGFHGAMAMLEVVQALVHDHDPHPELFDALVAGLRAIGERTNAVNGVGRETAEGDGAAVAVLLWRALEESGHRPELEQDVAGGGPLKNGAVYWFSPSRGGFFAHHEGVHAPPEAVKVRGTTLTALREISVGGRVQTLLDVCRALRLLAHYARHVAGRDLPALGVFCDMLSDKAGKAEKTANPVTGA